MSAKVTELIALHYQAGGSDKIWAAAVVEETDGSATMLSCWGRRGASLQTSVKAMVNSAAARKLFNSKKNEKLSEGYGEIDCSLYGISSTLGRLHPSVSEAIRSLDIFITPPVAAPREAPRIVVSHVTTISETELDICFDGANYGVTEKVNGTRCVVTFDGTTLHAYNRRGVEQPAIPDAATPLAQLGEGFAVDGERMEGDQAGSYVIFDLLEWDGQLVRDWPYSRRIEKLNEVLTGAGIIKGAGATVNRTVASVPGLILLFPATSPEDKRAVMTEVMEAGGEGIIVRTLDGPSLSGDTRYERKHKFVVEVDAVVLGIKPGIGAGSVRLGLIRPKDGAIIEVGCVRSGLRDADVAHLGALLAQGHQPVLTVSFLKARTVGINLVEPNTSILQLRTDKSAEECSTDQLLDVLRRDRASIIDGARPWIEVGDKAA